MATVYNKLEKLEDNKFGNIKEIIENFSTVTVPRSIADDMNNAIPIWVLLGLTEEEYKIKYQADPPVEESSKDPLKEEMD
jgi:hypothetical protein